MVIANPDNGRSQWPRGVTCRSAVARLLRLWVRIPPGTWMFVSREYCVLSGRGLCDELITRPEESYRLWCFVVCDLGTSWMRRPWPSGGRGGGAVATKTNEKYCGPLIKEIDITANPRHLLWSSAKGKIERGEIKALFYLTNEVRRTKYSRNTKRAD